MTDEQKIIRLGWLAGLGSLGFAIMAAVVLPAWVKVLAIVLAVGTAFLAGMCTQAYTDRTRDPF